MPRGKYIRTIEIKQKNSDSNLGKNKWDSKHKKEHSNKIKNIWKNEPDRYINSLIRCHSIEANKKRSKKMSGSNNPRYGKSWNKGLTKKDSMSIVKQSENMKKTYADLNSGYHTDKYKKNLRESKLGEKNPRYKIFKNLPEDKKIKWMQLMLESQKQRPNKPEKILCKIIDDYKLNYKYTGNGTFWITNINPDFVNTNGRKIVIELFGNYWHTLPDVIRCDVKKLEKIRTFGWDRIIIWENEILSKTPEEIVNYIKQKEIQI